MISRREWLGMSLGAGAALALTPQLLRAALQASGNQEGGCDKKPSATLMQRAIPSTGEMLPVIGLTFGNIAPTADQAALKEVLKVLVDNGGKVLDVMHGNNKSEETTAALVSELGIQSKLFLSTRGSPPGPPKAGAEVAKAHIEASFTRFKVQKIDLVQVTHFADPTHLAVIKEMKKEGRVRHIGIQSLDREYDKLEALMRNEPIDFVGVDYSVDRRTAEEKILPLAKERKIGVLAYLPFGQGLLFKRAGTTPLPDWAAEFDAKTWAQFFIKYVLSNPAVTVVRTGTSNAKHMLDNIGGGIGRLPDEAIRKRMTELVDTWAESGRKGK